MDIQRPGDLPDAVALSPGGVHTKGDDKEGGDDRPSSSRGTRSECVAQPSATPFRPADPLDLSLMTLTKSRKVEDTNELANSARSPPAASHVASGTPGGASFRSPVQDDQW